MAVDCWNDTSSLDYEHDGGAKVQMHSLVDPVKCSMRSDEIPNNHLFSMSKPPTSRTKTSTTIAPVPIIPAGSVG